MRGKVYLVGTGPGDPGLVTQKAFACIEEADVLVYDRLIPDNLLTYGKKGVEKVFVGKQPGGHTMSQGQINELLIERAKQGHVVTRLKGGDPFVFGRGGEEALALSEEKIKFEIVPGITSAVAAPMYAGIPLTHRGVSSSFAVITGHEDPEKTETSINWEMLATATDTLCCLMGISNLGYIVNKLMENGRAPSTPVALVRWGTRPYQKTLTGTLENIEEKVRAQQFKAPAVILVGEVAALRHKIAWFENKPFFGKTIIVTRPEHQAGELTQKIRTFGGEPVEIPAIKIAPLESYRELDTALTQIEKYNWLVFTSLNGVEAFFQRLAHHGKDARTLGTTKVAVIGTGTEKAIRRQGIIPELVPEVFRGEALAEAILQEAEKGEKVLIPRAKEAREILPRRLSAVGLEVDVVPAYKTIREDGKAAAKLSELMAGHGDKGTGKLHADAITFTSSSTVKNFIALLGEVVQKQKNIEDTALPRLLDSVFVACIGPITAETCRAYGIQVDVEAKEYTIEGLVDAMSDAL